MRSCTLVAYILGALTWARADEAFVSWEASSSTTAPSARSRFALAHQEELGALSTTEHYAWLYGGLDASSATSSELWQYDVVGASWTQRTAVGTVPPACRGCALVSTSSTALYLLMGESSAGTPVRTVHRLDLSGALTWSLVANTGPAARTEHTATVIEGGSAIVLFGGKLADDSVSNEAWRFDVGSGAWGASALALSGTPPAARTAHTATAISESLVAVFGGRGASDELLNDLYVLDTCALTWTAVGAVGSVAPAARRAHMAALVGRFLIVAHGLSAESEPLNDTWSTDAFAMLSGEAEWHEAAQVASGSGSSVPAARWAHAAIGFASGRLLTFGGLLGATSSTATSETWLLRPSCSGTRVLTAASGVLTDGAGAYASNLECVWVLSPSVSNVVIELTVLQSALADATDLLRLYDGTSATSTTLLSHTGDALPSPVLSTGGHLSVRLTTGQAGNAAGFRAAWRTLCAAGHQPSADGTCVPCAPGSFKSRAGDFACSACGTRAYAELAGSRECVPCPSGSSAPSEQPSAAEDCECEPGFFKRRGACGACVTGALCPGGSALHAKPGWCQVAEGVAVFKHCCSAGECPGGKGALCSAGVLTMGSEAVGSEGADPSPCAIRQVSLQTVALLSLNGEVWSVLAAVFVLVVTIPFCGGLYLGYARAHAAGGKPFGLCTLPLV